MSKHVKEHRIVGIRTHGSLSSAAATQRKIQDVSLFGSIPFGCSATVAWGGLLRTERALPISAPLQGTFIRANPFGPVVV
jgi:hypothetical protein